jgi:hypothetical protein
MSTTLEHSVILDLPWNVAEIWAQQQKDIETWFESFRSKPAAEEAPVPKGWDIIETSVPVEEPVAEIPAVEAETPVAEVPVIKKKKVSSKKKKL